MVAEGVVPRKRGNPLLERNSGGISPVYAVSAVMVFSYFETVVTLAERHYSESAGSFLRAA